MEDNGVRGDFCAFQDNAVLYSRTGTNTSIGTDGNVGTDLGSRVDRRAGVDVNRWDNFRIASARLCGRLIRLL